MSPFNFGEKPRERPNEQLLRFFDRIHAEKVFDTPEHRENFLRTLTYSDFEKWMTTANGMLREKKVAERGMESGIRVLQRADRKTGKVKEVNFLPPPREDVDNLLQQVWEAASHMPSSDAAVLLGAAIPTIHPFLDGNGRLGRLAFRLLADGYSGSVEDKKAFLHLLGEEGQNDLPIDLTRILVFMANIVEKIYITRDTTYSEINLDTAEKKHTESDSSKSGEVVAYGGDATRLIYMLKEKYMSPLILFEYLRQTGRLREPFFLVSEGKPIFQITKILDASSPEDLKKLLKVEKDIKTIFVHELIEMCKNPRFSRYFFRDYTES